jgi:hypothetical protein
MRKTLRRDHIFDNVLTGCVVVAIVPLSYSLQTVGNNTIGGIAAIVALSEAVLVAIISSLIVTWSLTTNFCKKKKLAHQLSVLS